MNTFINVLITFSTGTGFLLFLWAITFLIRKISKGRVEIEINSQSIKISTNKNLISSARIAYVEMSGRKITQKFEENYDVISEVYDSYYNAFKILRELKKNLSKTGNEGMLYNYINDFSEKVMRPHLTKYQSKYRSWLKKEQRGDSFENENTSQKKYLDYKNIIDDIKKINEKGQEIISLIEKIAYKRRKNDKNIYII